jgi:hypothetical protein
MTDASQNNALTTPRAFGSGYLFGIPLSDLGLFTSFILSVAIGVASFFAATFCAIVALLGYKVATSHMPDFTLTYKWVGLPVGLAVLVIFLVYLGTLWARRKFRKD